MPNHRVVAAVAAAFMLASAHAQQQPFAGQPAQPPASPPSLQMQPQPLAAVDATSREVEFMLDAARANLAEIEAGKLGMQRGTDLAVRQYAQRLVQEHTVLQQRLQRIASNRGVVLPQAPSRHQRNVIRGIAPLTGEHFDLAFLRRVGLEMHRDAIGLYHQVLAVRGADGELRQYAREALPVLQVHLDLAQTVYALHRQESGPSS